MINGFGYDVYNTMLVGLPGGVVNILTTWFGAFAPRFIPSRYSRVIAALLLCCIPLVGAILLMTLPASSRWGIVVSTWMAGAVTCLLSSCSALMASNVKGNTKKSVTTTSFFVAYCVGCIVSPQAWTEDAAPRYIQGCILSTASLVFLMVVLVLYAFLLDQANRKRDQDGGPVGVLGGAEPTGAMRTGVALDSDLTDIQDEGFRYTL